jgi:signal transduction histidine kinase
MMAPTPDDQPRYSWWIIASVVSVALIAVGAFLFVNSFTTGRALDQAEALHQEDLTLSVQDVAMKSIGQLVLIAQDRALRVATDDDIAAASAEADRAVATMGERFGALDSGLVAKLTPAFEEWHTAAVDVTSSALSGMPQRAADALSGPLAEASARFVSELSAEREATARAVSDARDGVSALTRTVGFLIIFLMPLVALFAYWLTARRQLRQATAHLDARIDVEKTIGRAKDHFVASISNELRTPLTSIYGFSEKLLDKGLVDPQASDLVDLINQGSAELARRVEDLIVAAHDSSGPLPINRSTIDMDELVREVIEPFQKQGYAINGTWGGGAVSADPLRVRQILRNLIVNAVEHGGPDIRIFGDAAGSRYVLSVEDNGSGVPRDVADKLSGRPGGSEPLTAGSTGLGLVVAQLLAQAMGGSLDYDRVANRTALVVSLPLATRTVAEAIPALAPD